MSGQVFYFAYGSNLLSKRMTINIKSAVKYANGLLKGYKFGFSGYGNFWKGSTANIVPQKDSIVWGVIWTVSESDLQLLDKQEVGYNGIDVNVCVNGSEEVVSCRTYVQKAQYMITDMTTDMTTDTKNTTESSTEEDCNPVIKCVIPSATYKSVIIKGAIEQSLPQDYIETVIKSHPDNGILNCGPPDLL